jgi:hypothetical protein
MKRTKLPVVLLLSFGLCAWSLSAQDAQTAPSEAQNGADADNPSQAPDDDFPFVEMEARTGDYFQKGDGLFNLRLGGNGAIATINPNDGTVNYFSDTNIKYGLGLTVSYLTFVTNKLALGGEVSPFFNSTLTGRMLYTVPLTFECVYMLGKAPYYFPVGIGAGVALSDINEYFHVDPIIKPRVGFYYQFTTALLLGIEAQYQFIPQIYYENSDYNRIGNFLTIQISAVYHM